MRSAQTRIHIHTDQCPLFSIRQLNMNVNWHKWVQTIIMTFTIDLTAYELIYIYKILSYSNLKFSMHCEKLYSWFVWIPINHLYYVQKWSRIWWKINCVTWRIIVIHLYRLNCDLTHWEQFVLCVLFYLFSNIAHQERIVSAYREFSEKLAWNADAVTRSINLICYRSWQSTNYYHYWYASLSLSSTHSLNEYICVHCASQSMGLVALRCVAYHFILQVERNKLLRQMRWQYFCWINTIFSYFDMYGCTRYKQHMCYISSPWWLLQLNFLFYFPLFHMIDIPITSNHETHWCDLKYYV